MSQGLLDPVKLWEGCWNDITGKRNKSESRMFKNISGGSVQMMAQCKIWTGESFWGRADVIV